MHLNLSSLKLFTDTFLKNIFSLEFYYIKCKNVNKNKKKGKGKGKEKKRSGKRKKYRKLTSALENYVLIPKDGW